MLLCPSIKFLPIICGWITEAAGRGKKQMFFSLVKHQLLLAHPKTFTGQKGHGILPVTSGSIPGSPSSRMCWKTSWSHLSQLAKPLPLTFFHSKEQQLYLELPPDNGAPQLSVALTSHPTVRKLILAACVTNLAF